MAIVKARYTRSPSRIKAHLRYITHRPGRDGEKRSRSLFTYDYQTVEKAAAYHRVDNAQKGTYFYKIILSPDPTREDTKKDLDLRHVTERTMYRLTALVANERGSAVQFVAAVHNDHTNIRHIHTVVLLNRRLTRHELDRLWQGATYDARLQRRLLDRARQHPRLRFLAQARLLTQPARSPHRYRSSKGLRLQAGCFHCGYGQFSGISKYRRYCPNCHKPLNPQVIHQADFRIQR